jgi:ADP-ribosylglycohydrolase
LDGKFTPFGYSFDQGSTCIKAITNYVRNNDTEKCGITGEWANGNGALMRIMPVCLYVYERVKEGQIIEDEALEYVHQVSALTHNHLRSRMACGIYYFIVKAILQREGSLVEMISKGIQEAKMYYQRDIQNYTELLHYGRIFETEAFKQLQEDEIESTGYVVDSLEAAIWSLLNESTFGGTALRAVNLGKDTDTVGAIACGLAGLYYGYEAIPSEWLDKIQCRGKIEEQCGEMRK